MKTKSIISIIAAVLFLGIVIAYPVGMQLNSNMNFNSTVYHCSDSSCSSLSELVSSEYGNPITYSLSDFGSGTHYFAEYDFVNNGCYVSHSYINWVDSSTGNGPWNYNIQFAKQPDCSSTINSVLNENSIYSNQTLNVAVSAKSPFKFSSGSPQSVPDSLKNYYSANVSVKSSIKQGTEIIASQTISKDLFWGTNGEFNFVFSSLPSGNYTLEIVSDVPDCMCSNSVQETTSKQIQILPVSIPQCLTNSDCGSSTILNYYCSGLNVYKNVSSPVCLSGACGAEITHLFNNSCTYGCLAGQCNPYPTSLNGQCSLELNQCISGTFNDIADNSTNYLWKCLGINGGANASCSLAISIPPSSALNGIKITAPSNNQIFASTAIPLQYAVNGTATSCYYSLDSQASIIIPGCQNITRVVANGTHNFKVYASNGTKTVSDSVNFTVSTNQTGNQTDTTPPIITIISPINKIYISNSITINVSINEQGSCTYNLDNGTNKTLSLIGNYFIGYENSLSNGNHAINVFCLDLASNKAASSVLFSINYHEDEENNHHNKIRYINTTYEDESTASGHAVLEENETISTPKQKTGSSSSLLSLLILLIILALLLLIILIFVLLRD